MLWVSNLLFNSVIIVLIKKTVLILELRTLMVGEYFFVYKSIGIVLPAIKYDSQISHLRIQ